MREALNSRAKNFVDEEKEANEITAKVIEEIIRRAPDILAKIVGEHKDELHRIGERVRSASSVESA